jgi:hypothetical protein
VRASFIDNIHQQTAQQYHGNIPTHLKPSFIGKQRNDITELFPRLPKLNRRQLPQRYRGIIPTIAQAQ